jgi:Glutathione-dependent formaldehyde-activating enzyme
MGNGSFGVEPKGYENREDEMEIKGGCLCGAVRYKAEADPTSATVCHCRDCQKFTGSAFAALVRVPKEAVTSRARSKRSGASAAAVIRFSGTSAPNAARRSPKSQGRGSIVHSKCRHV